MALSNWDTIAFGSDSKCCDGSFVNPRNKASVDIYKNWLYLRSPSKNPEADYQYTGGTMAQIDSGEISILGFKISATRHDDQSAIFVYAEYTEDRGDNLKVTEDRFITHRFGGIGCYGYKDIVSEVLAKLGLEDDGTWMAGSTIGDGNCVHHISRFKDSKLEEVVYHDESKDGPYDYSDDWVGVKPETLEAFFKWLEGREDPSYNKNYFQWVKSCREADHQRYNQGDAFFADKLNLMLPATEVGKAEEPIMSQMLKEIK